MSKRLTPAQVGRLALHVQSVVTKYADDFDSNVDDTLDIEALDEIDASAVYEMEAWERELERLIDGDTDIPYTYQEICDDDDVGCTQILEMLLDYYSTAA